MTSVVPWRFPLPAGGGLVFKKGFCRAWHGGAFVAALAESTSRDFGSTIFVKGVAGNRLFRRPGQLLMAEPGWGLGGGGLVLHGGARVGGNRVSELPRQVFVPGVGVREV